MEDSRCSAASLAWLFAVVVWIVMVEDGVVAADSSGHVGSTSDGGSVGCGAGVEARSNYIGG